MPQGSLTWSRPGQVQISDVGEWTWGASTNGGKITDI